MSTLLANFRILARSRRLLLHSPAAFTLLEVMVGSAVVSMTIGAGAAGLLKMQDVAMESRLLTCAQTVAQNQVDRIIFETYIPQNGIVANVLRAGPRQGNPPVGTMVAAGATATHYWDFSAETKTTGNLQSAWYSPDVKSVPVYDPKTSVTGEKGEVYGTVAIAVKNPGLSQGGDPLNLLQATVTVTYPWRGRQLSVVLTTQRTSDL